MITQRLAIAGFIVFAVLGVPRQGAAGLIDFIWAMSGPQMKGLVIGCDVSLTTKKTPDCDLFRKLSGQRKVLPKPDPGKPSVPDVPGERDPTFWLSLEGGLYGSTERDTNNEYGWWDVGMVALDPIFQVRTLSQGNRGFRMYHGAGVSYNFLFGERFRRFDNLGAKLRPVTVEYRWPRFTFSAALTFRYYADEFTSADFGFGTQPNTERPRETVRGLAIGIHF